MILNKFWSTKVQGFWFFSVIITIMLGSGKLDGGEFIAGMTIVFGIFSGANVMQKKVLNGHQENR